MNTLSSTPDKFDSSTLLLATKNTSNASYIQLLKGLAAELDRKKPDGSRFYTDTTISTQNLNDLAKQSGSPELIASEQASQIGLFLNQLLATSSPN